MTAKYGSQVVHFKYPATDRNCIDICKEKDLFLLVSCRIHGAEGQSSSRYNIKENESQKKRGKRVAKEWNQEWPPHPKRKWRSQAQWVLVTSRSCLKSFCRQPLSSIISFHFSSFFGGVGFLRLWPPIGHFSSFEKLMTGRFRRPLNFDGRRQCLWRDGECNFHCSGQVMPRRKFHALPQMNDIWLTFGFRCRNIFHQPNRYRSGMAAALWRPSGNLSPAPIWISRQSAHREVTGDVNTVNYSRSDRWPWQFFFSRSNMILDSPGYLTWPWTLNGRLLGFRELSESSS